MGVAALGIKMVFVVLLLLGTFWVWKRASSSGKLEGKGRPGRKSGKDRRSAKKPVARDRREEPRRQEEVADAFLKDLDSD